MRRKNYRNDDVHSFIRDHLTLFIFTIVLFVMGVVFGSIIIHSLSLNQKQELISYISTFFYDLNNQGIDNTDIAFKTVVFDNLKYLALLWFLGLSIIGMPLIFMLVFMKGFLIGFTISFFISHFQWKGFLFSLVSVIPQNLLIVPVYIIAGVAGTLFSMSLIKSRGEKQKHSYQQTFLSYSFLVLILGGVLIIASLFETFISPSLMRVATTFLIK